MLVHITFVILFLMIVVQPVFAQQASMVWDEASKSWISAPTTPPTTATAPPQPQQIPQAYIPPQQQIPVTAGASTVDLGTLMTIITPILAGVGGLFVKNRKDMDKKDEEIKKETIKAIEEAIIPKLKQITPVAEQTAKQDVKISMLAEELYKIMAEKADTIHDKPEIQQQRLIEDVVKSKMIADQTKQSSDSGSMKWDDVKKEWVSR
jgi:hypothetical protein